MHCPRCNSPLQHRALDAAGVPLQAEVCVHCGGMFLPAGALTMASEVHRVALVEHRHVPSMRTQMSPLACPRCGGDEPMMKTPSHRDARVVVDTCPRCRGTWLDRGELDAIQEESLPVFLRDLWRFLRGG